MRTAIFPGSFDPFTAGHLDVLDSALKLFDKVIVAVGYNSNKAAGFFPVDIRMKIIRDSHLSVELYLPRIQRNI